MLTEKELKAPLTLDVCVSPLPLQAVGVWTWWPSPQLWPARGTWRWPRSSAALWLRFCWRCWFCASSTARGSCWRRSPAVCLDDPKLISCVQKCSLKPPFKWVSCPLFTCQWASRFWTNHFKVTFTIPGFHGNKTYIFCSNTSTICGLVGTSKPEESVCVLWSSCKTPSSGMMSHAAVCEHVYCWLL